MTWNPPSTGTAGRPIRCGLRYCLTTGWARHRDCLDALTDGYGQPLHWWALAILTVLVPWMIILALGFEMLALRLDR